MNCHTSRSVSSVDTIKNAFSKISNESSSICSEFHKNVKLNLGPFKRQSLGEGLPATLAEASYTMQTLVAVWTHNCKTWQNSLHNRCHIRQVQEDFVGLYSVPSVNADMLVTVIKDVF